MYSIAIDGPSGSGKSTIAKAVAKRLGFLYVDTGAIYRTVGLFAKKSGIDPHDEVTLGKNLDKVDIKLKWVDGTQHVFLSDEDVSEDIRTPEMSMYASAVSALGAVRKFLLEMQRDFARNNNVIMDGRDIGTVILPNATVKFFMTASNDARAVRRHKELCEKGEVITLDEVKRTMAERDKNDSTRKVAPAIPAADAIMLDNSGTFEETIEKALEIIRSKI